MVILARIVIRQTEEGNGRTMEVERVLMLKADEDVKQNPPRGTVVEKFNHDSQNVTPESSSLMKDPKRLGYLD